MFVGEEYQQMKKNWIKNIMSLALLLISQGCSNPLPLAQAQCH
jgi:hypothetical protein